MIKSKLAVFLLSVFLFGNALAFDDSCEISDSEYNAIPRPVNSIANYCSARGVKAAFMLRDISGFNRAGDFDSACELQKKFKSCGFDSLECDLLNDAKELFMANIGYDSCNVIDSRHQVMAALPAIINLLLESD